jgi:hypothetical protein
LAQSRNNKTKTKGEVAIMSAATTALSSTPRLMAKVCPPSMAMDNLKGIMMCKRPSSVDFRIDKHQQRVRDASENRDVNRSDTFLCAATMKKSWGCNVKISEKEIILSRVDKSNSALSKQKRWLAKLQKEKDQRHAEKVQREKGKVDQIKLFSEQEAKKRKLFLGRDLDLCDVDRVADESISDECDDSAGESSIHECSSGKQEEPLPAWAMTEAQIKERQEEKARQEEEEFLQFVDDLCDIDMMQEDMERSLLIDDLKSDVANLARERDKEENVLRIIDEREEATLKSEKYNRHTDMFNDADSTSSGVNYKRIRSKADDEVQSIADSIRSGSQSLWDVHSRKSVKMMVEKQLDKIPNGVAVDNDLQRSATLFSLPSIVEEPEQVPPIIITHKDDDGARLAELKSLRRLPFQNRNPAI